MSDVILELKPALENDPNASVDDGETFLTVAKDKSTGTYLLYQPDRENYEFVALPEKYISSINSNKVDENSRFKVWGNKSAWDETPSPIFNI